MIRPLRPGAVLLFTSIAAGCAQSPNAPLIFGQTHTVGITIAATPVEQGGELTRGYRDRDIAIVPVSVTQADGLVTQLGTHVFGDHRSEGHQPDKDAAPVFDHKNNTERHAKPKALKTVVMIGRRAKVAPPPCVSSALANTKAIGNGRFRF